MQQEQEQRVEESALPLSVDRMLLLCPEVHTIACRGSPRQIRTTMREKPFKQRALSEEEEEEEVARMEEHVIMTLESSGDDRAANMCVRSVDIMRMLR